MWYGWPSRKHHAAEYEPRHRARLIALLENAGEPEVASVRLMSVAANVGRSTTSAVEPHRLGEVAWARPLTAIASHPVPPRC